MPVYGVVAIGNGLKRLGTNTAALGLRVTGLRHPMHTLT